MIKFLKNLLLVLFISMSFFTLILFTFQRADAKEVGRLDKITKREFNYPEESIIDIHYKKRDRKNSYVRIRRIIIRPEGRDVGEDVKFYLTRRNISKIYSALRNTRTKLNRQISRRQEYFDNIYIESERQAFTIYSQWYPKIPGNGEIRLSVRNYKSYQGASLRLTKAELEKVLDIFARAWKESKK